MAEKREIVVERERRAWALRQQGWTHERIAGALGVDKSTITKMLGRLGKRYAAALAADVAQVKGQQLAVLDHVLDEALQAWERSKQPAETTTVKTVTAPEDATDPLILAMAGTETTRKLQGQTGNAAYLSAAMSALADARKILGLDAPQKLADGDGNPLELVKVYLGVDLERI